MPRNGTGPFAIYCLLRVDFKYVQLKITNAQQLTSTSSKGMQQFVSNSVMKKCYHTLG